MSEPTIVSHYLAYGSNLHPARLGARVSSSQLVGVTRLTGYVVRFAKRGRDGSAKCDLAFTGDPVDIAFGAVYRIGTAERSRLDAIEGLGAGYDEARLRVEVAGETLDAFTYFAAASHRAPDLAPYDWYQALVVAGARYHAFPEAYVMDLEGVRCLADPDRERREQHASLLAELRRYEDRQNEGGKGR